MKLHEILIGFIFVAGILVGLMIYLSGGTGIYGASDFNETQYENIEVGMEKIKNITEDTKENLTSLEGSRGFDDLLGTFITSSYSSVQIAGTSADVFFENTGTVVEPLKLGDYGNVLVGIIGSIIILLFIGIFLHVITGSDRV